MKYIVMNENIYHVIWSTYNSRVSERMKLYKVVSNNNGVFFDLDQEYEISLIIKDIVLDYKIKVLAYNICKDHVHILLFSKKDKLNSLVGKIKGKSTKIYKDKYNIENKISLWGQKFNYTLIENKKQLLNTIDYINNNREKHGLSINDKLKKVDFCIKIKY